MGKRSVVWLLLTIFLGTLALATPASARLEIVGKPAVHSAGNGGDYQGRGPQDPGEDQTDPDDPFELDRVFQDDRATTTPDRAVWQAKWFSRLLQQLIWMSRTIR